MAATNLVDLLRDERDQIVARFTAAVARKDLSPPAIARSLLVDHIPKFLDEIADEVRRLDGVRSSHDAIDTSETARQHGEQRWNLGYDLEALIREYGVLRHCIVQTVKDAGISPSLDEFDVLSKCLSVGVAEAVKEYVRYRDAQFDVQRANLEFLSEAGQLLSSSLDYRATLSSLTGLVVPRMADWCAIHLDTNGPDEMPIAHVDPSMIAGLREIYRRYPLPKDSPYEYPHVVRSGESQLMAEVDAGFFERIAQDDQHLGLLRQLGSCSWLTVPLRVQGSMFGAMTLAYSSSGRHYTSSDLLLAEELARRAAVAIDNARLFDLSQKERARVEAATRAKDEFVAMVSHELRTPLNAILGWLRLMRGNSLGAEKQAYALQVIERNAEAQGQLVSDLLDISRVITGKIRIHPSQVDLSNVVDMAVEGIRPAAEAKRIELTSVVEREHAVMRGDGDRLQQITWSLLGNAIKFTPKNGRVTVRLARVASDLELVVEDNGEGIDASFLPHVFEAFRQSDGSSSRVHGGLGIGLSIAKHLVELHGGSIEARSAGKGKGATFVVRLPVSPLVSATFGISRIPATRQRSGEALPTGLQLRVLVADDDPDARNLVAAVLESCGMEVRLAGSAAEALGELTRYTPHVILSDIGMPDEDGYFLVRSIRTHHDEKKRSIPVIALTACARNEDRTRALVEGFSLHLAKPVESTELVRAIIDLSGHAPP